MNASLRIRGVHHRFGLTSVLEGIDLDLARGETLALLGPSGCGKSTLLRVVAGLLTPSEGHVHNGFTRLACVFQQPRLLPWKNALDNIALGLQAQGMERSARRALARELAASLGLAPDDLLKYPHALSGGMQSRVALGRAFAIAPDLLLLDEPFSALDVGLKSELHGQLRERVAHGEATVLLITHDVMEATRLADRIVLMAPAPGRLVREYRLSLPQDQRSTAWIWKTAGELMETPEMQAGFGLLPREAPRPDSPRSIRCAG